MKWVILLMQLNSVKTSQHNPTQFARINQNGSSFNELVKSQAAMQQREFRYNPLHLILS